LREVTPRFGRSQISHGGGGGGTGDGNAGRRGEDSQGRSKKVDVKKKKGFGTDSRTESGETQENRNPFRVTGG